MKPFLQLVARDLTTKLGRDLSRVAIVFPNKRAELFFSDYLVEQAGDNPMWAPHYLTINALFQQYSTLTVCDTIDAACRIYELYVKQTRIDVTLDHFYGWAERILADFDDIDKNMADAKSLLVNLSELKALDSLDYLTEEQIKVLQRFFADFDPKQHSLIRERFLRLWEALLPIYEQLNADLAAQHMAYEGALYRRVIESLESGEVQLRADIDRYVFVGFNVLDRVEQRLMEWLKKEGKAMFYWDYDAFYAGTDLGSQHFETFPQRTFGRAFRQPPPHRAGRYGGRFDRVGAGAKCRPMARTKRHAQSAQHRRGDLQRDAPATAPAQHSRAI